jgi:hypothetical protein
MMTRLALTFATVAPALVATPVGAQDPLGEDLLRELLAKEGSLRL